MKLPVIAGSVALSQRLFLLQQIAEGNTYLSMRLETKTCKERTQEAKNGILLSVSVLFL